MDLGCRLVRFRALLWVLVGLIPIHGMAAAVLATLGPAHIHRPDRVAQVELEDFRRSPVRVAPPVAHIRSVVGHFHHSIEPARHHHPRSEAGVVRLADDPANQLADGDEPSVGTALDALTPIVPWVARWRSSATTEVMVASAPWPLLTHVPDPLERPPRRA